MRASVPPPLACKASALPSELIPLISAIDLWSGTSTIAIIAPLTRKLLLDRYIWLENTGIDPVTSRMLSEHSTIWANSPSAKLFHNQNKSIQEKAMSFAVTFSFFMFIALRYGRKGETSAFPCFISCIQVYLCVCLYVHGQRQLWEMKLKNVARKTARQLSMTLLGQLHPVYGVNDRPLHTLYWEVSEHHVWSD